MLDMSDQSPRVSLDDEAPKEDAESLSLGTDSDSSEGSWALRRNLRRGLGIRPLREIPPLRERPRRIRRVEEQNFDNDVLDPFVEERIRQIVNAADVSSVESDEFSEDDDDDEDDDEDDEEEEEEVEAEEGEEEDEGSEGEEEEEVNEEEVEEIEYEVEGQMVEDDEDEE
jgi:hypothetical protein